MDRSIEKFHQEVKKEYSEQNRILSFSEYVELLRREPKRQLRSSAQYIAEMMDHFGRDGRRFRLFDQEFSDPRYRVVGQEAVQEQIYSILQSFIREGVNNKLILLHGPNGSAKSSLINCIMRGMEEYSTTPEGALYRFHWIFPVDRYGKPSFGLGGDKNAGSELDSYAKLPDAEIAARITCELKDHPLFLVPLDQRKDFVKELDLPKGHTLCEYLAKGDLSQKSKLIFEALLRSYKGDYKKVLAHVQVERFYVSRQYRTASVTVEPQMHVDAQAQQVTMDKSVAMLPSSLQFLSLVNLGGDLIDGNRGLVEYNDILKRPIDASKYLLAATETGTITVGGATSYIDTVFIGTCNEAQLDAFKEYPDFPSFKARIELVRAPYLLQVHEEEEIYKTHIKRLAGEHHVAPHTLRVAAFWSVLTRLKKPNAAHYPGNFAYLVNSLTPLEKARFYDTGDAPVRLSSEEKKHLRSHMQDIRREYSSVPYYEGRLGASPREMKIIIFNALERNEKNILSPLGLLAELEEFVKRTTEYDYLREDVVDGYHDCKNYINVARDVYLDALDAEVRSCLGVHDDKQYEDFLKRYILNVTATIKKEKIKNPVTGRSEDPDAYLMEEFEKVIKLTEDKHVFRQNLMTQLGVYALDNQKVGQAVIGGAGAPLEYAKVFPDMLRRIRDHYIDEHTALMRRILDAVNMFDALEQPQRSAEQQEADRYARSMLQNMATRFGYNDVSAKEAFVYLVQKRY